LPALAFWSCARDFDAEAIGARAYDVERIGDADVGTGYILDNIYL
jgi:hypothetical protein